MRTQLSVDPPARVGPLWLLAVCRTTALRSEAGRGNVAWLEKHPVAVLVVEEGAVQVLTLGGTPTDLETLYRQVPRAREEVERLLGAPPRL